MYGLILIGGLLITHWWWTNLHPYIESNLLEFFISHLLLMLGIWFFIRGSEQVGKMEKICIFFFIIYGIIMALLLIPGGFEEIGVFAMIIPVYLVLLGIMLGATVWHKIVRNRESDKFRSNNNKRMRL